MDRELTPTARRRRIIRFWLKTSIPLFAVTAVTVWGMGWLSPGIERNRIRMARVETGDLDGTLEASGMIVPEFDQVITSPVDARVLKIVKRPGDSLQRGEAILILDAGISKLNVDKLNDNIALKINQQAQLEASLNVALIKADNTIRIKRREIEADSNSYEQNKKLFENNYISRTELNQFVIRLNKGRDELELLQQERSAATITARLQKQGLALEIAMLNKDKTQLEQDVERAAAKAERPGVLTWVVQTEGTTLRKGEIMARIADLSSFRTDAQISDVHRAALLVGMPAMLIIGEQSLNAVVSSIQPTIENGVVKFSLRLINAPQNVLRPNLRVDVHLITAQKRNVLRVKKDTFARGSGIQEVFVLQHQGNDLIAVRRSVHLGVSNAQYYEIISGLQAGEEIICSDMSDYLQVQRLTIR